MAVLRIRQTVWGTMRNTPEKAEKKADRTCFKSIFLTRGWPAGDSELRRIPMADYRIYDGLLHHYFFEYMLAAIDEGVIGSNKGGTEQRRDCIGPQK
jgi:hypothetical protein